MQGNEDYPVSSYAVTDWITTFTGVAGQAVVEEEAADMAKYGLDHPAAVYSIREGGNVHRISSRSWWIPIGTYPPRSSLILCTNGSWTNSLSR
ncbi:DUF4340 domain-containing protein [Bacillus paralicheniformis]|nr:DUF4340 domain-containing protein [Bacillus paralicheniformis]UWS64106.1 DUF4340 domain-containing protein [Bacillus paralicheniformis]